MLITMSCLRPIMFRCRGIDEQAKWITQCTKHIHDQNNVYDYDQILKLYKFLSANTLWVQVCMDLDNIDRVQWQRFAIIAIQKIRQMACWDLRLYHSILSSFPIRLCKYCLLYTSSVQSLCSFHLSLFTKFQRELPYDLCIYIMQFVGVYHTGNHNYCF